MIPFIPIILFIAVQATLGVKYEKDHHGEGSRKDLIAAPGNGTNIYGR